MYCIALTLSLLLSASTAIVSDNIKIYTNYSNSKKNLVYNLTVQPDFNYYGQVQQNCVIPKVLHEDENTSNRSFVIENQFSNNGTTVVIDALTVQTSRDGVLTPKIEGFEGKKALAPGSKINFSLVYNCSTMPIKENDKEGIYWVILSLSVKIAVNQSINFDLIKICRVDNDMPPFDFSVIILVFISVSVVGLTTRLTKITSFQKNLSGHEINVKFTLGYMVICSVLLITMYYYLRVTTLVYTVIVAVGCIFATTFFLKEMLDYIPGIQRLKKSVPINFFGHEISVSLIICIAISLGTTIPWAITKHWIASDILALFIVGASFKIIKVSSLKKGIFFLFLTIWFEIIWGIILNYVLDIEYDTFFSSSFVLPFKLECPTFKTYLNKKCTWLAITDLVFPGLFISYLHRFDSSKNIKVYYIVSMIGFSLGNILWIVFAYVLPFSLPLSMWAFPLMIGVILIMAYQRNEHMDIWFGTFYDIELLEPMMRSGSDINIKDLLEEIITEKDTEKHNLRVKSEVMMSGEQKKSLKSKPSLGNNIEINPKNEGDNASDIFLK